MRTAPLSPGELAHLPEFVEKWRAIGHSTAPIDRDWAEGALARFYELAGLSEPWVVWAPCPVSGLLSATVYAAIISEGRTREIRDPDALDHTMDRVTRNGRGRVKTPALRLRVESSFRFHQSENQKHSRAPSGKGNRENNAARFWLTHVFTRSRA
jgi:hypothetical protein